jgi:hypothetical protein
MGRASPIGAHRHVDRQGQGHVSSNGEPGDPWPRSVPGSRGGGGGLPGPAGDCFVGRRRRTARSRCLGRSCPTVSWAWQLSRRVSGCRWPSVLRWRSSGRLPTPDFVTATGRDLWLPGTIESWLTAADLARCPQCGARCVSLAHHRAARHQPPNHHGGPASGQLSESRRPPFRRIVPGGLLTIRSSPALWRV